MGSSETVRQAADQLALMPEGPEAIGCVLVDHGQLHGRGRLPVLGTVNELAAVCGRRTPDFAVVCLPAAMGQTISGVRQALQSAGVPERFLPPMADLLAHTPPYHVGLAGGASPMNGSMSASNVDPSDLIGRRPRAIDRDVLRRLIGGQRVLITGAGGSIGSELTRIAAEFAPAQLQLLERAENALFEVDRQLARRAPGVERRAILHDVVDSIATARLVAELRPNLVIHAAAHKHVPLMEDHPAHAITNNLFGTKSIADASLAAGVERFVLVSTDKAVNPTSVMGATKRLAEMYVQHLHASARQKRAAIGGRGARDRARALSISPKDSGEHHSAPPTAFSMVRFGNVMGSACSVLTIWSAQLADGGPITVTDPRMTRFFMTIPEAAALVLQSAAIEPGPGAPVYVLDMGEPVRVLDLAARYVRAHGFAARLPTGSTEGTPGLSAAVLPAIDVAFTGVRPGEKLHEELSYGHEALRPTRYEGIRVLADASSPSGVARSIDELDHVRHSTDRGAVVNAIRRAVPEMRAAAADLRAA